MNLSGLINVFLEASGGDIQQAVSNAGTTAANTSPTDAAPLSMCSGNSIWGIIVMYAAIGLVFYFFIYRPQKKRRQQDEMLRSSAEIGDEIVTVGGICGRIVSVKEDDVIVIETGADRTKLKMKSWCISSNESAKERMAQQNAEKGSSKGKLFGRKSKDESNSNE